MSRSPGTRRRPSDERRKGMKPKKERRVEGLDPRPGGATAPYCYICVRVREPDERERTHLKCMTCEKPVCRSHSWRKANERVNCWDCEPRTIELGGARAPYAEYRY